MGGTFINVLFCACTVMLLLLNKCDFDWICTHMYVCIYIYIYIYISIKYISIPSFCIMNSSILNCLNFYLNMG